MVEHPGSFAEAGFALRHKGVHSRKSRPDFTNDFVGGHAARLGALRRFSPAWQVPETGHHKCPDALPHSRSPSKRLSLAETTLESPYRPGVGEVEVFQN